MQTWTTNIVIFVSVYIDTQMLDCKEQSQWRLVFRKESHVSSKNVSHERLKKKSLVDTFDNWRHNEDSDSANTVKGVCGFYWK